MARPIRRTPKYRYDACRTPFRIALDACWFGEPRVTHLARTTRFFSRAGAARITDGYDLTNDLDY